MIPANVPRFSTTAVLAGICVLLAAGVIVGAVVADDHTQAEAPTYDHDGPGDATFEFLDQEDHHPGADNASVRYTLRGGDAFEQVGATDGIAPDWFVVETDAVDHSDCDTENVAAFGVDRGDDGDRDVHDDDLLQHVRQAIYFDEGVAVEFYDYEDFGGDPPVIYAEDRIVLELSDEAAGGACVETTEDVGWYDADLFLNGTGPRGADREDETYGFTVESPYTYVCECEDETEAREQIGHPPGPQTPTETSSGTATETSSTPTATETDTQPTTPTPGDDPVLTATVEESVGGTNVSANVSVGDDGVSADASVAAGDGAATGAEPPSPTPEDAPGFGTVSALVALLGTLLVMRRRGV